MVSRHRFQQSRYTDRDRHNITDTHTDLIVRLRLNCHYDTHSPPNVQNNRLENGMRQRPSLQLERSNVHRGHHNNPQIPNDTRLRLHCNNDATRQPHLREVRDTHHLRRQASLHLGSIAARRKRDIHRGRDTDTHTDLVNRLRLDSHHDAHCQPYIQRSGDERCLRRRTALHMVSWCCVHL